MLKVNNIGHGIPLNQIRIPKREDFDFVVNICLISSTRQDIQIKLMVCVDRLRSA